MGRYTMLRGMMDWLGTCCILGYNDLMITSYFFLDWVSMRLICERQQGRVLGEDSHLLPDFCECADTK